MSLERMHLDDLDLEVYFAAVSFGGLMIVGELIHDALARLVVVFGVFQMVMVVMVVVMMGWVQLGTARPGAAVVGSVSLPIGRGRLVSRLVGDGEVPAPPGGVRVRVAVGEHARVDDANELEHAVLTEALFQHCGDASLVGEAEWSVLRWVGALGRDILEIDPWHLQMVAVGSWSSDRWGRWRRSLQDYG